MSDRTTPAAGLILAGGRSRRFGRDKALADLGGRPLIAWSAALLRAVADPVAVSGPAALGEALGIAALGDPPGLPPGPLAGIVAGLVWAREQGRETLLTLPCDTPFVPQDFGARLLAASSHLILAAARAERAHPLCGAWSVALEPRLRALATQPKQPSLQSIVEELGGGFVDFADEADFANVNTPEDMIRAEARLADRPRA